MSSEEYSALQQSHNRWLEAARRHDDRLDRVRRRLYVVAITTIAIFVTDAVPTRVEPLGITFSDVDALRILLILSTVSAYFVILFIAQFLVKRGHEYRASRAWEDLIGHELHPESIYKEQSSRTGETSVNFLHTLGENVRDVVLVLVPIIVGMIASLVGYFPDWFVWLKQILVPPA